MTRLSTVAKWSTFVLGAALAVACGDGDGDGDGGKIDAGPTGSCEEEGGQFCFERPTMPALKANGMPANFACDPDAITTSAQAIVMSGTVDDFQTGNAVAGATVEAFLGLDFSTPVAMATADAAGLYTLTLPSGMAKSRMNFRTKEPMKALDTYGLNSSVDVSMATLTGYNRGSVSKATANALPAFIGVTRTAGLGVLAGSVVDCDGDDVQNAIATVASASGGTAPTFVAGPQSYYFSAGSPDLPVRRTTRIATNTDGLFVIIEIPPTTGSNYFLQVWGYKDAAAVTAGTLTLLSELEAPVVGDSVISVSMDPNQGQ